MNPTIETFTGTLFPGVPPCPAPDVPPGMLAVCEAAIRYYMASLGVSVSILTRR